MILITTIWRCEKCINYVHIVGKTHREFHRWRKYIIDIDILWVILKMIYSSVSFGTWSAGLTSSVLDRILGTNNFTCPDSLNIQRNDLQQNRRRYSKTVAKFILTEILTCISQQYFECILQSKVGDVAQQVITDRRCGCYRAVQSILTLTGESQLPSPFPTISIRRTWM